MSMYKFTEDTYRISHGLWLDNMILSKELCVYSQDLARKHKKVDKNHIQPQTMGDFFITFYTPFLSLHNFSAAF